MYEDLTTKLMRSLEEKADPKRKDWWESYVKNGAPFMGVRMADIRSVIHQLVREDLKGGLDADEQLAFALSLFACKYSEQKLAGTLLLHEVLIPAGLVACTGDLDRLAHVFRPGAIYDWNLCDWFSVKVLAALIEGEGEDCARRISSWRKAEYLWQARASVVAFVPVIENALFHPHIEESCRVLIRRRERFAKTAVGWILRELSAHDQSLTRRLVEQDLQYHTADSLKNALKNLKEKDKRPLLRAFKSA